MKKIEYLQKIKNLIVNRIKYHAPNLNTDEIDFELLSAVGIDASLPIFVFPKPMNRLFFRAFKEVKRTVDFNLICTKKPQIRESRLKKLADTFLLYEEDIGGQLWNNINALNINYLSHCDFNVEFEGEYIKFNNEKLELEYCPYYKSKKVMDQGIVFQVTEFLLNGKNYSINISNTHKEQHKISFEFNLPLPRGYYFFKQDNSCVTIENLCNRQKAYFNFNFKGGKLSFSSLNGIESCTFACINFKYEISLLPLQSKKLYFNFSDEKFCFFSPKEVQQFFESSQNKLNEIFDIRLSSHDKQFDRLFNLSLPQNIWEKWQNFDFDEKSENDYLKYRSQIITQTDKGLQINPSFKGLKEVKFYRNSGWKRVFVVHNNACYMFVDKVKYFNYTLLTKEIFNKNNEIYLSFAE